MVFLEKNVMIFVGFLDCFDVLEGDLEPSITSG